MAGMRAARWSIATVLVMAVAAGCSPPKRPDGTESAMLRPGGTVVEGDTRMFTAKDFTLESGRSLPELTLAYETYGQLAPDGRNAILITHGFTSNHHAAGKPGGTDEQPGFWSGLIGPGKTIDTDRYFVVSSNMLGSSYGSTAPRTVNPVTGKPYGPDFPTITLRDIVTAQKALLDSLDVRHLIAVAGPSFGGYQAFQWAVAFPDHMSGIVPVVSAPRGSGGEAALQALIAQLARDPNWNGGWYYDRGGIPETQASMRFDTLSRYGYDEALAGAFPDPAARRAEIRRMAEAWTREFDPNSLVTLRRAAVRFDAERDLGKMRAKVLYVLSRTDKLFPPSIAPAVMAKLAAAGVDARYAEIDTDFGHSASGREWAKWAPALRDFLASLPR